jgi:AcrR family transcriptional regulator
MSKGRPARGEERRAADELSFSRHLAIEAARADDLTKGERTRRRVKAAAAAILEGKGYHDLQMADIARSAGLSHGAVYKYFDNKKHVTLEVLTEFVERSMRLMLPDQLESDAYERIYQATLRQVKLFVANVGLARCIRQLGDELPEFNELVLRTNAEWNELVARGFVKRWQPGGAEADELAIDVAHALGSMVDEQMYDIFVRRNPRMAHYRQQPERLAQIVSLLWYRAAYGENPASHHLDADHPILALASRAATPGPRLAKSRRPGRHEEA